MSGGGASETTRQGLNRSLVLCAGLGALAGAWTAFADYGALWLWLPVWRDRVSLLVRLLGVLTPVGALLGACLGVAVWGSLRLGGRREALVPVPAALVAIVPMRLLALKLCSGGSMAQLSFRSTLEWALTLLLPCLVYAGLWPVLRGVRAIERGRLSAPTASFVALALSFGFGKLNQTLLPNLYDYLHAALALGTWLLVVLGLFLARFTPRGERWLGFATWRPSLVHAGLGIVLLATVTTLDHNLNVRVAMFDARAPTSRALLGVAHPLLAMLETRPEGTRQKSLGRGAIDTTGLPTQEGAHVVLITIDALRADHLGLYGYARPVSPALDALAQKSTVFERAYAQAPHSSYSLSSLHTSEYLHEVVELGRPLPEATLATTFKANGYHTAAFFTDGIFHTEGAKLAQYRDKAFGFDLFDHTNRESEDQTDRVLKEVDRIKSQGEPPSFLWVHYFDVHEPYQETRFGTGEMDRYDSEIAHTDREVARLLRELEARFERKFVVAITADHGEEFREHGGVYHGSTLYDEQVRVPLIVRADALPAMRYESPVEVIDVAPTLLGLAKVPVPESMRGRDLRAAAMGRMADAGPVFSAVLTKRMALRYPIKLIADLRFNLFELYDLSSDPKERKNLAQSQPEKLAEMRGYVYAWLDSLETTKGQKSAGEDEYTRALRWGRLGDRRAVEPMSRLILDTSADTAMRTEAGQILAKLADESSADALVSGLDTTPPLVAAEAAIALGRMYDTRAQKALRELVHTEDPYLRARAAVSLGRLRDREAVPALIEALWVAPTQYEREEAVRWLGRLRDRRGTEPLISLLPEFSLRYLLAVALGQIGDPRAYDALSEMIGWEKHTNIRDEVVRGLGLLGDVRAAPLLVDILRDEAVLKNTGESLVRLGAPERGELGGLDVKETRAGTGLVRCVVGPLFHDWDYLGRTYCITRAGESSLKLPVPKAMRGEDATLVVRVRREGDKDPVGVRVGAGSSELGVLHVDHNFVEFRLEVPGALLHGDALRVTFASDVPLALDHALLVSEAPKAAGDTAHVP